MSVLRPDTYPPATAWWYRPHSHESAKAHIRPTRYRVVVPTSCHMVVRGLQTRPQVYKQSHLFLCRCIRYGGRVSALPCKRFRLLLNLPQRNALKEKYHEKNISTAARARVGVSCCCAATRRHHSS